MYDNIRGKKLLVLGATPSEIDLVKRAQEFGVYVIVTDYHSDWKLSPAKYYADEGWNISWSDIDTLETMCRENHVDGVTAGYSEFRVENTIRLCERLDLPCYCTMEQLEITRDKIKFKNACRENGVPVVKEFASVSDVDKFPVIVKPVDRAGSIGISIATNQEELDRAYTYAMEMSICKKVIIEEFITRAVKVDIYYEIVDGQIELVSSYDAINAKNNGYQKVVQSGSILPSIHHKAFKEKVDQNMQRMMKNMGIKNGYMFFSGFADKNSNFAFFECGFRLCGGQLYNYFSRLGFYNNMDIFILHALTGSTRQVAKGDREGPNLKCVAINLYAKPGIIREICGFEEIAEMDDCCFSLQKARVGEKCDDGNATLTKLGRAYFCNESIEQLSADVSRMYELFKAVDENGNDLVYDRIDPNYIVSWWKGEIIKDFGSNAFELD